MKKKILIVTLFLSVFLSGMAVAGSINGDYKGRPIVKVVVNGQTLNPEVPANIEDGNTLLPLRAVSEALGAAVTWHPDTYTVYIDSPLSQDRISEISKSVAKVYAYDANDKPLTQGSGIIVDGGKHGKILVTANHVGGKGPNLRVEVNGEVIGLRGQALFSNEQTDVYAAKINTSAPALSYSHNVAGIGTNIIAFGYPGGNFQVSKGVINALTEDKGVKKLGFNASVDHGSSGGLLVDNTGLAVGMAIDKYETINAADALPLYYVQEELSKLK